MPAHVHNIDFPAGAYRLSAEARLSPSCRKVIPFPPETGQKLSRLTITPISCCQRGEAIAAVLLSLIFHLVWLVISPEAVSKEPVVIPAAIQVALIDSPRPPVTKARLEPQKQQKQTIKPKTKAIKPVKIKQKTLISTTAPVTEAAVPQTSDIQNTASPAELNIAEAAVAKPSANAVNTDSAASAAHPAGNRQAMVLPNLNADYLNNPTPRYPEDARERGEQGKVLVRALINTDGSVAELVMRKSSGYASLDRAALDTVKKWRFVPARRGVVTVAAWVVVPITFSLEG